MTHHATQKRQGAGRDEMSNETNCNLAEWLIGAREPKTGNRELDTVKTSSKREALSLARAKWGKGYFDFMARVNN